MPRKVRQLMANLEHAGYVNRGGKGSHWNFAHPQGITMTQSRIRNGTFAVPWRR